MWRDAAAELSTLLAMFAGQKEKPAVLGQHFTQTDNTDCYLLNWRLSVMASHVGTGIRQEDHPQASTQHLPGRACSHPPFLPPVLSRVIRCEGAS